MNVTCKVMTTIALCAGFLPTTQAANINVPLVKIDPTSRKQMWSYKIIPKTSLLNIRSPKLQKFQTSATLSINPKSNESTLRVYTNSTGSEKTSQFRDLSLTQSVLDLLQHEQQAISVDKDGGLNIVPADDLANLIKSDAKNTRDISVERVGKNRDEWTIASWGEGDWAVDGVTIEQGKTKAKRKLAVPKTGRIMFLIHNFPSLIIEKDQAAKLKVLKLTDEGKQAL